MPKISVVVPAHNAEATIEAALESALAQSFKDYELIVIDNGSRDQTREKVSRFVPPVLYFYQEDQGRAGSRNAGIQKAKGEYIALLDSDDVWKKDWLEKASDFLDQNPEIGLVHGEVEAIDEQGRFQDEETRRIHKYYEQERQKGSGYERLLEECAIFSSAVMFRKTCLSRVGLYDPQMVYEDYDWYLRFSRLYRFALLDGPPRVQYRRHSGNVALRTPGSEISRSYLRTLEKQLVLLKEEPGRDENRVRILVKMAEFQLRLGEHKQARRSLYEALRKKPALISEFKIFRHAVKSLLPL